MSVPPEYARDHPYDERGRPPQPGVVPLAPLGLGDLFSGIFGTIGRHWRALLVIGALAAVVVAAATLPMYRWAYRLSEITPDTDPDRVTALLLDGLGWLPVLAFLAASVSVVAVGLVAPIVHAATTGQRVTLREGWRRARPQVGRLLLLAPVVAVGTQVGLLLCVLPGLLLGLLWSFAAPALVIERCTVVQALRRSWHLVSREFWRVLGITVLVSVAVGFVSSSVTQASVLPGIAGGDGVLTAAEAVWTTAGSLVATAITVPVVAVNAGLLYLDTRIRHEGYGVALARAAPAAEPLR